jgi:DNA-binding MarR family transcriptional regulator
MRTRPNIDDIHSSIAHVQRLSDLLQQRRQQLAQRVGLTEQQWRVLEEIATEHFIPSLFAKSRESSAAAVSKVLRQLLDKDLVRVSVSATDGRQRQYELTPKGQKAMERLRSERQRAIDAIWADLPADDLSRFSKLSGEIAARIERYAADEERAGTRKTKSSAADARGRSG